MTSSTRPSGSPPGRGRVLTTALCRRRAACSCASTSSPRGIEQALIAARVPVRVAGALGFCERAEIRDALAALALVANPRDRLAFARVAQRRGRRRR